MGSRPPPSSGERPEGQVGKSLPTGRRWVRQEPPNAELPGSALSSPVTPEGAHFVRCHFAPPAKALTARSVSIAGAVAQPRRWSHQALRALAPERTLLVTLECAGNSRTRLAPLPPGEP